MDPFLTNILLLVITLYLLYISIKTIREKKLKELLGQVILVCFIVVVLNIFTGFPNTRESFGTGNVEFIVIYAFIAMLLGIVSNYFYFNHKFCFYTFIRPILVSPMVFIPVLGVITSSSVDTKVQILSICLVAFQNGFFWRSIFEKETSK